MKLSDLLEPYEYPKGNSNHMTYHQNMWRENGFLILDDLIPHSVLDAYSAVREKADGWEWRSTPYMDVPELMNLCCQKSLADVLEEIIGEPCGVHLNLCNWTTTGRDWHPDYYLNPINAQNFGKYCAVWVALDNIHPDSGPFEFVRSSHRWGRLTYEKILDALLSGGHTTSERKNDGSWPHDSEKLLTDLFNEKIADCGWPIERFIAKKGQVLIWHPDLWHRGSKAKVPGMIRKSVISHYSGIHHRKDFPTAQKHEIGGWFFPIKTTATHARKA